MMQVIRVCDDDGGVGLVSKAHLAAKKVCVNAWSISAYASVCTQHVISFTCFCVCVCTVFMDTLLPSQGDCGWC